jgi:hypothetical protein
MCIEKRKYFKLQNYKKLSKLQNMAVTINEYKLNPDRETAMWQKHQHKTQAIKHNKPKTYGCLELQ